MSNYQTLPDGRRVYHHTPGASLDYIVNWGAKPDGSAPWLDIAGGETITTSSWTATRGITLSQDEVVGGTVAVVFAAGGELSQTYTLTNTITTNKGRTDSRVIVLLGRQRDR